MTIGEQILRLSAEYTDSVAARDAAFYGGNPVEREPARSPPTMRRSSLSWSALAEQHSIPRLSLSAQWGACGLRCTLLACALGGTYPVKDTGFCGCRA
jgi:hypothetical protein